MHTDEQIIQAMHKEHCFEGMVELYHAWHGYIYTYVYFNQETLYIVEDLEAPLNEFKFRQFLSTNKIIELMVK